MTNKSFTLWLKGSILLDVEEIWPNGDAPDNPTAEDVLALLLKEGSVRNVLRNWSLDDVFKFEVD